MFRHRFPLLNLRMEHGVDVSSKLCRKARTSEDPTVASCPWALRSAKYGVLVLFTCVRDASINILRISGSSASATGIPNRSAPPCLLDLGWSHSCLYSVQSLAVVCYPCSDIGPGICPYVVGVSTSTCEVK